MDKEAKVVENLLLSNRNDLSNHPTVVSLFCGAGGMDLGFLKAGFRVIWACDNNEWALRTFNHNFDCEAQNIDVRNITRDMIPNNPDVITGGFPCQGFSSAGKRRVYDPRNSLAWEMIRIIQEKRPKFFVGENVLGIRSMKHPEGGLVLDKIISDLTKIGYTVKAKLLDASKYGVPQRRKRIFIIGNRLKLEVLFPPLINRIVTLKDVIDDLPDPDSITGQKIKNHVYKPLSPSDFKIVQHVPPGGNWKDIPYKYLTKRLKKIKDNLKYYKSPAFYKRPEYNKPTGTVSATMNPTHCTAIHPFKNRRFTVRECARIQTFPDDFEFIGEITECYRQVGNAVPPKLGYEIAKVIKKQLVTLEPKIKSQVKLRQFI